MYSIIGEWDAVVYRAAPAEPVRTAIRVKNRNWDGKDQVIDAEGTLGQVMAEYAKVAARPEDCLSSTPLCQSCLQPKRG